MTRAVAGHGTLIAMELDPTGSPGVFTTIAELGMDIDWFGLNRPQSNVTPHQDDIDSHVSGVMQRDPFTFGVNHIFDDETHDHLTGLIAAIKNNEFRGFRVRGPGGTTNTDEWIGSGVVSAYKQKSPVREGPRTAEVTVQLSGPMIVDGTVFGNVVV